MITTSDKRTLSKTRAASKRLSIEQHCLFNKACDILKITKEKDMALAAEYFYNNTYTLEELLDKLNIAHEH